MTWNVRNTLLNQGTWLSFEVTGHPVYSRSKYGALHQDVLCNLLCSVIESKSNITCIDVNVPFFLSHCHFPQGERSLILECVVSDMFVI